MALNLDELIKSAKTAKAPRKSDDAENAAHLELIFDPSIDLDEDVKDEDDEDETDYAYEDDTYDDDEYDEDEIVDEFEDEDYFEDIEDEPPLPDIAQFRPYEENNLAYTEAVDAYFDKKNYESAIGKFQDAIVNERKRGAHGPNETIAKSMYWQAESYVKTEAFEDASAVLESLIELFAKAGRGHYLVVAAQRRLETLKARGASHARNF